VSAAVLAARAGAWRGLRRTALALLLGAGLFGLIFWPEITAAVAVWNESTAYNHCFLVLPIALWMAYERRGVLLEFPVRPTPWMAALILPLAAAWLVAERLGIMEGRQLIAIACLDLLFLAVLGWRLCRALAAPILYLFFLVPFGAFLTPALQQFTVKFIVIGLSLLGVPNFTDGNTIEIPEGVFFVAEACAGLRFLIASIAFGVLYAVTLYRSPGRRVAFIAASTVVPVIANGFRALGIVAAGHWIGSAQAAAADHLIYGWLFFSAVTLLLILAGLPFRQDGRKAPPVVVQAAPPRTMHLAGAAVLAAAFAATGPVFANWLDRAVAAEPVSAPGAMSGCTVAERAIDAADLERLRPSNAAIRRFACSAGAVTVTIVLFPSRTNLNVILAAQRVLTGETSAEDAEAARVTDASGAAWSLVTTTKPSRVTATQLWIEGRPALGGLRSRLQQARNSVVGAAYVPALVLVGAAAGERPGQAIQQFLNDGTQTSALSGQMVTFVAVAAAH
jgi:exosortase A